MIRRIFGGLAAAIVLLVVPVGAAQAYPAPTVTFTVSDATPAAGEPFTVTATGLGDATEATLTITSVNPDTPDSAIEIAGTQALTKPVTDGAVSFEVTLGEPGEYELVLTTDAGSIATQVVTVVGAAGGGADDGESGAGGGLADTGANVLTFGGIGLALVAAGGLALLLVRRSRRAGSAAA